MTTTKSWHSPGALTALIDQHLGWHPVMEPRDAYKLIYQGIMGLGHLVTSPEDFGARLRRECGAITAEDESVSMDQAEPLWQAVRPDGTLGRLNLRPFKARQGKIESLISACLMTAGQVWGTPEDLRAAWKTFVKIGRSGRWPGWPQSEVLAFATWIEAHNYPVIHHSARYTEAYRPAYRLVQRSLLPRLELDEK